MSSKKSSGCLKLLLLFMVPMLFWCGLSYTGMSLGPLDGVGGLFPGQFGRKDVTIDDEQYRISLTIPRSWYRADDNDKSAELWQNALNKIMPFKNKDRNWNDLNMGPSIVFIEVNPAILAMSGFTIFLAYEGISTAEEYAVWGSSYDCEDIREATADEVGLIVYNTRTRVIEMGNGLCGVRQDSDFPTTLEAEFDHASAPNQAHFVRLLIPFSTNRVTIWDIGAIGDEAYAIWYEGDIEALIESIEVEAK